MKLDLENIKDKESGKIGIALGLGPSLRSVLPVIEKMNIDNRDKASFYSCNMFNSMMAVQTDYWVVCNPQKCMHLAVAYNRYNSQDATFVFTPRINGFTIKEAEDLLTVDYIPISDQPVGDMSLSQYLKDYTNSEAPYPPVESVIIHMIALAIISGCKEVYISGVDLDYKNGYVKEGAHKDGVHLGKTFMNAGARTRTINHIRFLRSCAKNVGCELYTLNETGPLSEILEFKDVNELKNKLDEK